MHYSWGAPVRKNFFLLQSVMKRNPFRTFTRKNKISLLFALNFWLPTKAKLVECILLCFASKNCSFRFVSLLFRFVFASFHFRFPSDAKTSEKNLLGIKAKNILLLFCFISLRSENDGSFLLQFRLISLRSKNNGSFSLLFCFISLQSKNDSSFSLLFRLVPFFFRFRFLCFASMRNKQKKIRFYFASFHFEAKMMAHPNSNLLWAGASLAHLFGSMRALY
jgi:hypothetical protein